jgi:hypothetical protein
MLHATDTEYVLVRGVNLDRIRFAPHVASVMLCTPEHPPFLVQLTNDEARRDLQRRRYAGACERHLLASERVTIPHYLRRSGVVCIVGIADYELFRCVNPQRLDTLRARVHSVCMPHARLYRRVALAALCVALRRPRQYLSSEVCELLLCEYLYV